MPKQVTYNYYHKTKQDMHLARMGQKRVSLEALGVYFLCRNLAGKFQHGGFVCIGEIKKATTEDLINLLVSDHNIKKTVAQRIVKELYSAGYFLQNRAQKILLADWEAEQETAKTYEAERKANWRARQKEDHVCNAHPNENQAVTSEQAAAAFAAAPTSISISSASDSVGTMSQSEMGHCPQESESNRKKEIYNSISISKEAGGLPVTQDLLRVHVLPSGALVSDSVPSSFVGAAAKAALRLPDEPLDVYDETIPPEIIACRLVGESGAWSKNGYRKKVAMIGENFFRMALAETSAAINEGAASNPAGLLHSICERIHKAQQETAVAT